VQRILAPAALGWLAINLWSIHRSALPYTTDELQYWLWSEALAWGYYSKPPGIAFAMAQWRLIDPHADFLRALPQLLLLLACLLVHPLARAAGLPGRQAGMAALLMACIPFIGFAQWFATTDSLLLLFWNAALVAGWHALRTGSPGAWAVLGLVGALGVLSKHFMPLFLLGLSAYAVWEKRTDAPFWRGVALAALVAGLVLLPHLLWLFSHPENTLAHLADLQGARGRSEADQGSAWWRGIGFALAQAVGIGPLLIPFVFLVRRQATPTVNRPGMDAAPASAATPMAAASLPGSTCDRWLLCQSLPVLALFVAQAAWKQAYANWALPAAFTLGVWLLIVLMRRAAWGLLASWLLSNILLMACINHAPLVLHRLLVEPSPFNLTAADPQGSAAWIDRIDPFRRQRGWDVWIASLEALNKPALVAWAVRDRDSAARIRHAFPQDRLVYQALPGAPTHHYALHFAPGATGDSGAPAYGCLWVVERGAAQLPAQATAPQTIAQLTRPRLGGSYETWIVREQSCVR